MYGFPRFSDAGGIRVDMSNMDKILAIQGENLSILYEASKG